MILYRQSDAQERQTVSASVTFLKGSDKSVAYAKVSEHDKRIDKVYRSPRLMRTLDLDRHCLPVMKNDKDQQKRNRDEVGNKHQLHKKVESRNVGYRRPKTQF